MKIVTAWHRGSVATGDEIREARDNRRRIISYFIILLFSYSLICAFGGGEAAAAKLCQVVPPSWGLAAQGGGWVDLGTGCSNTITIGNCSAVYHSIQAFRGNADCSLGEMSTAAAPGAVGENGGTWCRLQNRKAWVCSAATGVPAAPERICGEFYSMVANRTELMAVMFSAI